MGSSCSISPAAQLHADAAPLRAEGAMDEIDHQALFLIERHPGVTLAELCACSASASRPCPGTCKQLAQVGLIEQEPSAQDRRKRPLAADGQGGGGSWRGSMRCRSGDCAWPSRAPAPRRSRASSASCSTSWASRRRELLAADGGGCQGAMTRTGRRGTPHPGRRRRPAAAPAAAPLSRPERLLRHHRGRRDRGQEQGQEHGLRPDRARHHDARPGRAVADRGAARRERGADHAADRARRAGGSHQGPRGGCRRLSGQAVRAARAAAAHRHDPAPGPGGPHRRRDPLRARSPSTAAPPSCAAQDDVIHLTTGEISLLQALAAKPGRSISRAELGDKGVVAGSDRAVDVQMARLRRKIEDDPRQPRYILTMRGSGYVLRLGS